ncbi:RNA polymerase sigma factor [Lacinutrix jangbogonensis]|uniref:RNA polymerase sigma factor n=1 Tax=Lacinutrix jangbogonensis TaxID=1469557 RepID=UPI00053EC32F|nr:sigma-70 family RNA polymerase sigma factor [Lacinutrix jangbogonensis]
MFKISNDIIKACINGEEKAQMQLYDNYCDAMYTIACRYLNNEDAKDAMQDGFIKAFSKLESYAPDYSFGAWLKRIIINQCLDFLRKINIETTTYTEDNLEIVDEEHWEFDDTITKETILKAISNLKEHYKLIITLYLIEGYDHEEISEILKIPVKTSRTQLRRARLTLQNHLKDYYNEARY